MVRVATQLLRRCRNGRRRGDGGGETRLRRSRLRYAGAAIRIVGFRSMHKLLVSVATIAALAGAAYAGGLAEPVMEEEVVEAKAGTSGAGVIIPLLLLVIIAAVLAGDDDTAVASGG
jgi:hypothetical protein